MFWVFLASLFVCSARVKPRAVFTPYTECVPELYLKDAYIADVAKQYMPWRWNTFIKT